LISVVHCSLDPPVRTMGDDGRELMGADAPASGRELASTDSGTEEQHRSEPTIPNAEQSSLLSTIFGNGFFGNGNAAPDSPAGTARATARDTRFSIAPTIGSILDQKAGDAEQRDSGMRTSGAGSSRDSARVSMLQKSLTVPALDVASRRQADQAVTHEGGCSPGTGTSLPPPPKSILRVKTLGDVPSGLAKQEVDELARSIKESNRSWPTGELLFPRNTSAKYMKLPHTLAQNSYESIEQYIYNPVTDRFFKDWRLRRPELLLWVTGQALGTSSQPSPCR
jgi:hypothetical protein